MCKYCDFTCVIDKDSFRGCKFHTGADGYGKCYQNCFYPYKDKTKACFELVIPYDAECCVATVPIKYCIMCGNKLKSKKQFIT